MSIDQRKICVITFDIEEWYHGAYPGYDYSMVRQAPERVLVMTRKILELLERYNARGTFFVLGEIARKYPELVKLISSAGQEIASHGFEHILMHSLSPAQFREQLLRSREILTKLSGQEIIGFRAPNFSISPYRTPWAFEILAQNGMMYDSSVFPAPAYYGGNPEAPRFIHKIDNIWEFPPSAAEIAGIRLAFSGGFYFRILPRRIIEWGINSYHKLGQTPILYLHPKDLDPQNPKLPLGWLANFVHKAGTRRCAHKFELILKKYKCISVKELLQKLNII